jgi:hypothetical protein
MKTFQNNVQTILNQFQTDQLDYLSYLAQNNQYGDEAMVRQKIVEPLLVALGYDLATEVNPEEYGNGYADIYVTAIGEESPIPVPAMIWELKKTSALDLTIHENQLQSYVLAHAVRYGVLTNGHEIRLYERGNNGVNFSFHFSLKPFAQQPTPDDEMALAGFYQLLNRASFLDVERYKQEIIAEPYHLLKLSPTEIHNENKLITELETEIDHLYHLVRLRFQAHQEQVTQFRQEQQRQLQTIDAARTNLVDWVIDFSNRLKLSHPTSFTDFLKQFEENPRNREDERTFVENAMDISGLKPHLKKLVNRSAFENRCHEYYRLFIQYRRWFFDQKRIEDSHALVNSFTHWQEEMSIMTEEPEREFCLQTVYIFVTRLLLIRICEDKGILKEKISDGGYKYYLTFSQQFYDYLGSANQRLLQIAYDDTRYVYGHFFSRDVFDWHEWAEATIVRFFWILNPYDFSEVRADVIGRIYEQYVDDMERKQKGQFYTPAEVVHVVLDAAEYEGQQIVGKRLLDPACGSGRFLLEACRRLIPQLKKALGNEISPLTLINQHLRNSLYGFDVNRFACFLAEVNLVVQALDMLRDYNRHFTIMRFHIYPTNSLLNESEIVAKLLTLPPEYSLAEDRFIADLMKNRAKHPTDATLDFEAGFDYIVGNPPYVRADNPDILALRRRIEETNRYPSLYKKWDLYIPFIDLSLDLLANGGYHAFIVFDVY